MAEIEGRAAIICFGVQRVRHECRRIGSHAGIHVVAVIERLRKGVGSAELQALAETAIYVHLQTVVGADAFGKPMCRVPDGVVRKRRVCRVVDRAIGIARRAR